MAYLDNHDMFAAAAARPAAVVDGIAEPVGFSALEWTVIALAQRDPLRSLSRPGRLARAMGGLFGSGTASPLADARLEALRRIAVLAWRRGAVLPAKEIERFLSAGFRKGQIDTLVASVTGTAAIGAPRS